MKIAQGLAAMSPPVVASGGQWQQIQPANPQYPAYTFHTISQVANNGPLFATGLAMRRIQIDTFGDPQLQGSDNLPLCDAITKILNGFAGYLPDPDATFVSSCMLSDVIDPMGIDGSVRTYERKLEFIIAFAQISGVVG